MDSEKFEVVFDETVDKSRRVLIVKAGEYAALGDRLHNFKQAGSIQGVTQGEALGGMLAKHLVSVYDYIGRDRIPTIEQWDEKIIDAINYLILLRAIVVEETEGKL